MSAKVNLQALGLNTSPNSINVPDGSMSDASNVIVKRDNIVESRRGFKLYGDSFGSSSDVASQLLIYQKRILRQYNNSLQFETTEVDSDGNIIFDDFSGDFTPAQVGLRTKGIESQGNFYFTSNVGIRKISALNAEQLSSDADYITLAGGVKAIDFTASLAVTYAQQNGFLPQDSTVAYRILWNNIDANSNLIQGVPSQSVQVYNPLGELLVQDFNHLLLALDNLDQGASLINDGNYSSSFRLNIDASSDDLRTNAIALASKIDNDILLANLTGSGAPLTVSTGSASANIVTINFSAGSASQYIFPGQNIFITGASVVDFSLDGEQVVSTITDSVLTFNVNASGSSSINGSVTFASAFTITDGNYRAITEPSVQDLPPTNAELTSIQTYIQNIITQLQTEPNSIIPSALSSAFIVPLDITTTAEVKLVIDIPQNVTSHHFFQIYRSSILTATGTTVLNTLQANDELQLVYEAYPTAAELAAGSITVIDDTPDEFAGAYLYTNASTGQGILQANEVPPWAKDINLFKNCVFYANTKTMHQFNMSLLGVSNILTTSRLTITNGVDTNTYSFVTGSSESTALTCGSASTVNSSGSASYFTINSSGDLNEYYGWYSVGTATDPMIAGKTGVPIVILSGDSPSQVAQKTAYTFGTLSYDFNTSVASNIATITNVTEGITSDATLGTLPVGFSISITQGDGEDAANKQILKSSLTSPAQAVTETALSLIRVINKNPDESVYGFYLSGVNDVPGKIFLQSRSLTDIPFYVLTNDTALGDSFNPTLLNNAVAINNISVANPSVITTATAHGLMNRDQIVISGSNSTPSVDGLHTITLLSPTTFSIPVNVSILGTIGSLMKIADAQVSDNQVKPNRVYYSKLQQPDAVPIVNYFDVGLQTKAILRIFPLRDSLFVFKEDGIYRISGEVAPFNLTLFDNSCILIAPDSVGVANNIIYVWTQRGIETVNESNTNILSRPIDNQILKFGSAQFPNFASTTWGTGYNSDNSYIVYTNLNITDEVATIGYRYGILTNSWTTYDKTNTCGVINPRDDKFYMGAGDTNFIEQERKSFDRTDYADRELKKTLNDGNYLNGGSILKINPITDVAVGDVVVQEQTLTIYQYNALLQKLDIDPGVDDTDYFSTLEAFGGDDLRIKLADSDPTIGLAAKLDADGGVFDTDFLATISTKSGSIVNISALPVTVITTSTAHGLVDGRVVLIATSNSTPTINSIYQITVLSPTTFSIPAKVTVAGTAGTFITVNNDFRDIEACFNAIINKLNDDQNVDFSNYQLITQITIQEAIVTNVNIAAFSLTLNIQLPFVPGPLIVFKAIPSTFTYTPVTMQDPLGYKHMREATIMFANKTFTSAILSFATDLLPAFIDVIFSASGSGIFGHQSFGTNFFGGQSHSAPFRTYIPRNAQRCRFMVVKFSHSTAREQYSVFGITLTGEISQSTRAYR